MSDTGKKRKTKKEKIPPGALAGLRRKAEQKFKTEKERLRELSSIDLKKLVHELGTHQLELEIQNEELRRARAELESSHARYVDLYDFSPVGYFTFDRNGLVKEVNLTGAKMVGVEKRLLRARPFQSFVDPSHRSIFRDHLAEVFKTQSAKSCEISLRRRDGTAFPAQLHSLAFQSGEEDPGACRTAVSDVTERKRAEDKVLKLNEELQDSFSELEAVNKDLETFNYSIAHDLRAPLRSIEGFTTAILEDSAATLSGTAKDYFERVVSASRRMSQLIDAMLSLARMTKGELRETTVNLSELAGVIAYELRKKDPARRVEFVIAERMKARGDRDMLRTVLENLLDNAWKFTGKHPSARIEFGATRMGDIPIYFVRDDGAGFMTAYADKLFQPFKRLHAADEFPGIGIGLATVKRIIHRHGGKVWAESAPGQGATFYFTLG